MKSPGGRSIIEAMENTMEIIKNVRRIAVNSETPIIGFADLTLIERSDDYMRELLNEFTHSISIATPIPKKAIEMITAENPGPLYAHTYRNANSILDHTSHKLSAYRISKGDNALPIPASSIVDRKNFSGIIPHKTFALSAGLGRIGRNLLLVNSKY